MLLFEAEHLVERRNEEDIADIASIITYMMMAYSTPITNLSDHHDFSNKYKVVCILVRCFYVFVSPH
jgi:hypothetical protein